MVDCGFLLRVGFALVALLSGLTTAASTAPAAVLSARISVALLTDTISPGSASGWDCLAA
ncbi:hypothetical protein [Paraburkholderia sp.]|uniref:hypothetical protein n=1 Tax=Paraburkholderia sp. TaxID=1926495 RepID=UPI002D669FBD|nr:hypothetical protein [Paraburkholderia sp.]HZZ04067.1 hypothetical protein [Paraburkholderia sp.]